MLVVIVCCSCFELHRVIIKVESEIKTYLKVRFKHCQQKIHDNTNIQELCATPQHATLYTNTVNMELFRKQLILNTIVISVEYPILVKTIHITNRFHVTVRPLGISINVLAFYHECRSLSGYSTYYLPNN